MVAGGDAAIDTMLFDIAGDPVAHVALEVMTTLIASPLVSVVVV